MEALTPPEAELQLLPRRYLEADWRLWRGAAAGSVAFHLVAVLLLITVKLGPPEPTRDERRFVPHLTPLYIPHDLTQKAPNTEPVHKEIILASIAPRAAVKVPSPSPAARPAQIAKAMPPPPPLPVAPPTAKPVTIEPPKMEAEAQSPQTAQLPKTAALPPPPSSVPPKLAFEDVNRGQPTAGASKPTGAITLPDSSIAGTLRSLTHAGAQQGVTVNDADLGGLGAGLNLPASAGRPQSSLQLASDPMGVDFRAYIIQVLAAVRRNWFAVYPEAARLGMRGQVVLKFGINKRGVVTTVNFSTQSGAKALDQSAVASISASNPLPPLPTEFKGDQIVLQMTFSYNLPRQ